MPDDEWLRGWLKRQFSMDWAPLRFQPLAFLACWLGTLFVLFGRHTSPDEHGFTRTLGTWGYAGWIVLSLLSPLLLIAAYICIHRHVGRIRYIGFWLRFAADAGQLCALGGYIITYLAIRGVTNDYRLYSTFIVIGTAIFLVTMVARDIWQLILAERIANRISRE